MCIKLWKRFKVNHEYHKYCIFWIISSNKSTGNRKWRQAEWGLMSLIGVTSVSRWNYNLAVTWNWVHGKSWGAFSSFFKLAEKKRVAFWLKTVIWLLPKRSVLKTCTTLHHSAWYGITGWLRVTFEDMNFLSLGIFVHWHSEKKLFWHFCLAMSVSCNGKPVSVQAENHPCWTDRRRAEE